MKTLTQFVAALSVLISMFSFNMAFAYDSTNLTLLSQGKASMLAEARAKIAAMSDDERADFTAKMIKSAARIEKRLVRWSDAKYARQMKRVFKKINNGELSSEIKTQIEENKVELNATELANANQAVSELQEKEVTVVKTESSNQLEGISRTQMLSKVTEFKTKLMTEGLNASDDKVLEMIVIIVMIALVVAMVFLIVATAAYWPIGLALFFICIGFVILLDGGVCWYWY